MSHKEEFYKQCLVLDFETTGKDFKIAEIIESGFCIREDNNWVIFQELHKPINTTIPPVVESITYITNKMVEDKLPFIETRDTFQLVVDGFTDGYMVGHNYFYDMKVGENHGLRMPTMCIDTWRLAKKLFSDNPAIEETNLPYLRFALELDVPIEMHCHRAGNDSFITAKLLEAFVGFMEQMGIIDRDKPYGPQIMEYATSPIIYETWPIGTHKGKKFKDIPKTYWKWAIDNIDSLNSEKDNFDNDLYQSLVLFLDE